MPRIAIINGPNLNLTGKRQPEIYGSVSFDEYIPLLKNKFADKKVEIVYLQSNHEGQLIDWIQMSETEFDGLIINAGGYTHTSIAIADAVEAINIPTVEIHLSDISKREPFRRQSYLTNVCTTTITGQGLSGYDNAIEFLLQLNQDK